MTPTPRAWQDLLVEALQPRWTDRSERQVEFDLDDGLPGFARLDSAGRIRLSLFLAQGGTETTYAAWIESWPRPAEGALDLLRDDDRGCAVLRLLLILDNDEALSPRCMRAAELARMYRFLCTAAPVTTDGTVDLLTTLAGVGVPAPPFDNAGQSPPTQVGPWHWATVMACPRFLYMFDVDWLLSSEVLARPAFSLNHAGHGVNSYGLTLLTTCGPVVAFVQHGFGGAYMDPIRARDDIAHTYARLHVLFNGIDSESWLSEVVPSPPEWLLTYSNFRGGPQLLRLKHEGPRPTVLERHTFESESEMFATVLNRLDGWNGNPAGVHLRW